MFHRVEEMTAMPGPRFCRLAVRLGAYQGALAARIEAERDPEQGGTVSVDVPSGDYRAAPGSTSGDREIVAIPAVLAMSDIGDMFTFGTG